MEEGTLRRHPAGTEPGFDERRRQPTACHGLGNVPASRRATSAASARVERSRTGPRAAKVLNGTPWRTARPTASGSSNSPRDDRGTSRHAEKIRSSKRQQFMLTWRAPFRVLPPSKVLTPEGRSDKLSSG